jgi:hypothetical protein
MSLGLLQESSEQTFEQSSATIESKVDVKLDNLYQVFEKIAQKQMKPHMDHISAQLARQAGHIDSLQLITHRLLDKF